MPRPRGTAPLLSARAPPPASSPKTTSPCLGGQKPHLLQMAHFDSEQGPLCESESSKDNELKHLRPSQ